MPDPEIRELESIRYALPEIGEELSSAQKLTALGNYLFQIHEPHEDQESDSPHIFNCVFSTRFLFLVKPFVPVEPLEPIRQSEQPDDGQEPSVEYLQVTRGTLTEFKDMSSGLIFTGYFLDGLPTFGDLTGTQFAFFVPEQGDQCVGGQDGRLNTVLDPEVVDVIYDKLLSWYNSDSVMEQQRFGHLDVHSLMALERQLERVDRNNPEDIAAVIGTTWASLTAGLLQHQEHVLQELAQADEAVRTATEALKLVVEARGRVADRLYKVRAGLASLARKTNHERLEAELAALDSVEVPRSLASETMIRLAHHVVPSHRDPESEPSSLPLQPSPTKKGAAAEFTINVAPELEVDLEKFGLGSIDLTSEELLLLKLAHHTGDTGVALKDFVNKFRSFAQGKDLGRINYTHKKALKGLREKLEATGRYQLVYTDGPRSQMRLRLIKTV